MHKKLFDSWLWCSGAHEQLVSSRRRRLRSSFSCSSTFMYNVWFLCGLRWGRRLSTLSLRAALRDSTFSSWQKIDYTRFLWLWFLQKEESVRFFFYSSFVYTCVCIFLQIQSPLRECRSIWSGTFRLPYYCAPLVCISVVIGLLDVWRLNKPNTKNHPPRKRRVTISIHFQHIITFTSTNIHVSDVHCGSAVRFGQALPSYLITAHHLYVSLL